MTKRIFSIGALALMISATTVSCNNDDSGVFSKNPMERESEQQKELKDLLVNAEQGWKFNYFPEESGLGGFTFLMKFNAEGKVTMVSDFSEEGYTENTTDYELQLRGTTSLVFVDETWIHKLSDPINSALRTAKGFEGEFQYRYYGFDDNSIFFRGTRVFDKEFSFVRATKEDWANFEERKTAMELISDEDVPLFRSIEVEKNGQIAKYDATYSGILRYLEFSQGASQELMPGKNGIGVGFSNDGLLVEPAIIVDGEKYQDFQWNESTKEFISSNGSGTSVKIKNVAYPDVWSDVYKSYMFTNRTVETTFFKEDLLNTPSISQKARNILTDANIQEIHFTFRNGTVKIEYDRRYSYNANLRDTGKSGLITSGSWSNASTVPQAIKDLHESLFGYGDLLLKEQRYNIKYTNQIVTLYCGGVVFDTYKR
ncbi:DUF4302 domain-containing protein [Myroides sp. NP-2]|uniref:DUF4302 domain-containing protein n=1 Tax=Myroides sp. NP-2 TaxID=2759945 RepID=UPI0015FC0440|nr:DUF4302 domain-containing protein [Myroides sp. NP-2]MBB1150621.1 DUF4302 domain-containing protein [Myroides sp. NP-2]